MKTLLFCLASGLILAQNPNTAAFPGAVATDTTLLVASNNGITQLASSMSNSQTTIVLISASNFIAPSAYTIEGEIILCTTLTSNTLSGCTRGFSNTTPVAHNVGVTVFENAIAWYHNQAAAEIKAVEATLGANLANVPGALTLSNDTSMGTTLHSLAKLSSAGKAVLPLTTDTGIPVFVVTAGAGVSGSATLATSGSAQCQADSAGVAVGHYIGTSTLTVGRCADLGATQPAGIWIVGQAEVSVGANATFNVLIGAGFNSSSILSGGFVPPPLGGTGTGAFTAGSVVFSGASGVYTQNNANLFWDNTNHTFMIGTNSPGPNPNPALVVANGNMELHVNTGMQAAWFYQQNNLNRFSLFAETDGNTFKLGRYDNTGAGTFIDAPISISRTTGDIGFGTAAGSLVDGGFLGDFQRSGSVGVMRCWDQTPSTGSTLCVVRAGAAQGVNPLLIFQDASGNPLASFTQTAQGISTAWAVQQSGVLAMLMNASGTTMNNAGLQCWTSTISYAGGIDSCVSRDSPGAIDFGTGAAGSKAARLNFTTGQTVPVLTSALPTCNSGNAAVRGAVSDATLPAIGSPLTGGGAVFATVHCSGTTNTYLVDGL